jgi:hypothetical protein
METWDEAIDEALAHADYCAFPRNRYDPLAVMTDAEVEAAEAAEAAVEDESGTICPSCGKTASFRYGTTECVETHGLDCGPYERWTEEWWKCSKCGDKIDGSDLEEGF